MNVRDTKDNKKIKILSFFIPIIGLIVYIKHRKENKEYANACGISSLIGLILVPIIIYMILSATGILTYLKANNSEIESGHKHLSISEREEIKRFNKQFELYEGTKIKGSDVRELIKEINQSNVENYHEIKVYVNSKETTNSNFVQVSSLYTVQFKKDSDGRINKVYIALE